jgi:Txe/YoeB family toxin of Txe-Axe toxin-antitoxin module
MLAVAEYAYNNSKHSSTKICPFYANYGFEPPTTWPTEIQYQNPASQLYGHYMTSAHTKLKNRLIKAVEIMQKHYNKWTKSMEPLKKGELVMLIRRNIPAKHRCTILEDIMLGPFKMLSIGSNQRYCKVITIDLLKWYTRTETKIQKTDV